MARRPRRHRPKQRRRCSFCRDGIKHIDYKDIDRLRKLITIRGQLLPRKRSRNCAKCQRQARVAVKHARFLALLPYIGK